VIITLVSGYLNCLGTYMINMQLDSERGQKKHLPYEIQLIY